MRNQNENMTDNDDMALGDQFDEVLTVMIGNLTQQLQESTEAGDRTTAVISGKRDMMQLLVDKTLEYFRKVDPQAEIVLTDLATQYEALIDQAINLANDNAAIGSIVAAGGANNMPIAAGQRQNREKDKEIKRLQE